MNVLAYPVGPILVQFPGNIAKVGIRELIWCSVYIEFCIHLRKELPGRRQRVVAHTHGFRAGLRWKRCKLPICKLYEDELLARVRDHPPHWVLVGAGPGALT